MTLSKIVLIIPFILVYISTHLDNFTAKVPIFAEIGARVQGSNSKIWSQILGRMAMGVIKSPIIEAAGIIRNGLYSVICVRINCSPVKKWFRFPPSFWWKDSIAIFYTMHSIYVLGKESKSWFYIKYYIFTHILVLLIKSCQFFRNCVCDVTH